MRDDGIHDALALALRAMIDRGIEPDTILHEARRLLAIMHGERVLHQRVDFVCGRREEPPEDEWEGEEWEEEPQP